VFIGDFSQLHVLTEFELIAVHLGGAEQFSKVYRIRSVSEDRDLKKRLVSAENV
jgi:hypothetical protein